MADSEHRPTATLQCDVFGNDALDTDDPVAVAKDAWESVVGWVHSGYRPVVTVHMEDGREVDVDLEEHDG